MEGRTVHESAIKGARLDELSIENIDKKLADVFQKKIGVSPLILGKYLKFLLGPDFGKIVQETIYKDCHYNGSTANAIADLCSKKNNNTGLKSIVTFNFDDVIEKNLDKKSIAYTSIYHEGERNINGSLPIYHAHGFLPKAEVLTQKNDIVFSEDGYHTQFIDSFSWSNLIQLYHLSHSSCLFIGISLTDPNMRRLLDIASRKNSGVARNHYIIKRRHDIDYLYKDDQSSKYKDAKVIPIIEAIEEQDAKSLGFNVIWVDNYTELPPLLKKLQTK